jgi:hypothetical protein
MALSTYTPSRSPSPASPTHSISSSSSSFDHESTYSDHAPDSDGETQMDGQAEDNDTVTCQWEGCGVVFVHLPTLIEHIHNSTLGIHVTSWWVRILRSFQHRSHWCTQVKLHL